MECKECLRRERVEKYHKDLKNESELISLQEYLKLGVDFPRTNTNIDEYGHVYMRCIGGHCEQEYIYDRRAIIDDCALCNFCNYCNGVYD